MAESGRFSWPTMVRVAAIYRSCRASGSTARTSHPARSDVHGSVCGKAQRFTLPSYVVPWPISPGAIVVAANAGSDYLFVRDRDPNTVNAAVASLQSRLQFGAIFVSDRHGPVAGTLPMSLIQTEHSGSGRAPDIIVSFNFDANVPCGRQIGRNQLCKLDQPQR